MEDSSSSILRIPAAIAILANEDVFHEVAMFIETLQLWNQHLPPIYCMCTTKLQTLMQKKLTDYTGIIHYKSTLDAYSNVNRQKMEQLPSQKGYKNRFHDFTLEKCKCIEWVLVSLPDSDKQSGILFCDVDILWTAPLPRIPSQKTLGLSPHMIQKKDEALYGEFNAGFLWTNHYTISDEWEQASKRSRFYEQAALEELADNTNEEDLLRFPETVNYGWWRMFQSDVSSSVKQSEWRVQPYQGGVPLHSGICVNAHPLVCVHTHIRTNDFVTQSFNMFFFKCLETSAKSNPYAKQLCDILNKYM
jgi:hypothetical protein